MVYSYQNGNVKRYNSGKYDLTKGIIKNYDDLSLDNAFCYIILSMEVTFITFLLWDCKFDKTAFLAKVKYYQIFDFLSFKLFILLMTILFQ